MGIALAPRPAMREKGTCMRTAIVLALSGTLTLTLSASVGAGMYAYPDKGQSAKQQQRDKRECQEWATEQTGVDPSKSPTAGRENRGGAGGGCGGGGSCGGGGAWGCGRRARRGRSAGCHQGQAAERDPAAARRAAAGLRSRGRRAAAGKARGLRPCLRRVPDGTWIHPQVKAGHG